MMNDKQIQKAGNGAHQIQANQIIINQGITEERARQILDEQFNHAIIDLTLEAHEVAEKRIQTFSNELIPRLVREKVIDCLRDPSVQKTLREAEKTAVGVEREDDHKLLSELLIHRIKKGSDYKVKSSVNQAVKIVDEISDDALLALTVSYVILNVIPKVVDVRKGLDVLNNLFSKIVCDNLPFSMDWIDHLDVIKAVRINHIYCLGKFEEIYFDRLFGTATVGIKKGSESYHKALDIINSVELPLDILMDHELRDGYVRLRTVIGDNFDFISIIQNFNGKILNKELSIAQRHALTDICGLYENNQIKRNENITKFAHMIDEYDVLKETKNWWNNINMFFSITCVGKVLAQANAKRCDPSFPDYE